MELTEENLNYHGYKLCLENSISLYNVACDAAKRKEFGIACALNILSTEEAVKALYLFSVLNIDYSHKDKIEIDCTIKELFTRHKSKHQTLQRILLFTNTHIAIIYEVYSFLVKAEELYIQKQLIRPVDWIEYSNKFHKLGKIAEEFLEDKFNVEKILPWLDGADNEKNKGLYVGRANNQWLNPHSTEFTLKKYEKEKKFSESIIKYTKRLNEFTELYELLNPQRIALELYDTLTKGYMTVPRNKDNTPLFTEYFDLIRNTGNHQRKYNSTIKKMGGIPTKNSKS